MSPDSPIDPADLETPTSKKGSKSLPNGNATSSTPTTANAPNSTPLKPGVKLPARVDVENIYISLRESLGDDWGAYIDAVRSFLRGLTNRTELNKIIEPLLQKPETQRLHNQYFLAVEVNATREPPEGDVATWVSHQGKTSSAPKTTSGDAYERRLKKEIMAIPARDRRRMKEIPEVPDDIPSTLTRHYTAKQIHNLDTTSAPPVSAGLNKNWQNEVANAYQATLAIESGEYIDTEQIQARCVPICFEEGISSHVSEDTARFIGLATDFFVKDILTTMIDRIRLEDGRRILKEDEEEEKLREKKTEKVGGTISMEHLRLSVSLSDNLIRQMPLSVYSIMGGVNQYNRADEDSSEEDDDDEDTLGLRAGKRLKLDSGNAADQMDVDGSVPDTVKWENPASLFLMECLSGH